MLANCSVNINTNINNSNETICVFGNIENNYTRLFLQKLKEKPFIQEYPNCKYILFTNLVDSHRTINTITGLASQVIIGISASYAIFENDLSKQEQIKNIINNPSMHDYSFWTGAKNAYSSRGNRTEGAEKSSYAEGTRSVYNNAIARIKSVTKYVNNGTESGQIAYSTNPILLTSETQSSADALEQLAVAMAQKVIDNVVIDIEDYKETKIKQQEEQQKKEKNNTKEQDKNGTTSTKKTTKNKKNKVVKNIKNEE